ncbi:MAG: glycosyl hydrolase family 28 protein [Victivallales bacterium]|nr:glycosyl hydrolase family 28 protein [Victivallales bacterium]
MFNIKDFGAQGDGLYKNTQIIQTAIDRCAAEGGGIVFFPAGVYVTGTIYLRDNVCLDISPGAVIMGSPDKNDYNADDFCLQNQVFSQERVSGAHLIVAVEVNRISIRGGGRIDGNRAAFYQKTANGHGRELFELTAWRPGQMLFICECSEVSIKDVELCNAPYWTCFLHGCENVSISGLRIWNARATPNGDGLDLDCCRRVTVSDCNIDTGDDCITLRAFGRGLKKPGPCEYVTVTNCVLRTPTCAFRVGVGDGTVRNCTVSNCVIYDTRTGVALMGNYAKPREPLGEAKGVQIENLLFSHLIMETKRPLYIGSSVHGFQHEASKPIRNIAFSHLRGRASWSSMIVGNADGNIDEISLSDMIFDYFGGDDIRQLQEGEVYGEFGIRCAPAAFYVADVKGVVTLDKLAVRWRTDNSNWTAGLLCENAEKVKVIDCDFEQKPNL